MLTLGAIAARATQCLLGRFDADRVLGTIERDRCTILETVPTMLTALLERQRALKVDLTSLRLVGVSGAPTPQELGWACEKEWGVKLRVLYGATELGPTVTGAPLQSPVDRGFTTVGVPLPWAEVRVVDVSVRRVTPLGVPGELEVRGPCVMSGYLNEQTPAIDEDGWFGTGDIGAIHADGYVTITGRLKDVIIRGGENLYPAEIEALVREHSPVLDCVIVGVPDPYYGEELCGFVQARPGHGIDYDELKDYMRARVTHQKVPRYLFTIEHLPLTASGKVQRHRLREQALRELQIADRAVCHASGPRGVRDKPE